MSSKVEILKKSVAEVGESAKEWFWRFFKEDEIVEDNQTKEEDDEQDNESEQDSAIGSENDFQDLLRRNSALHQMMTAFHVLLSHEDSKVIERREQSRELIQWAQQLEECADKLKKDRRYDFLAVLEFIADKLAAKIEVLAAEKDWLVGKVKEQDSLRDEVAKSRNHILRQLLKDQQCEFNRKINEIGYETFVKKCTGKNAEESLLKSLWQQLNMVNDVIGEGEAKLAILIDTDGRLHEKIENQKVQLSNFQKQLEVFLLRFVSENEFLLNGASFQLQVVELLNDLRKASSLVEELRNDIVVLKSRQLSIETGLEVLRNDDVTIARAVSELSKYMNFIDNLENDQLD